MKMKRHPITSLFTLATAFVINTLMISPLSAAMSTLPADYDKQHPYYIKFCSSSQWRPLDHNIGEGVPTGHAVFFLKGVCMDHNPKQEHLPDLRLCAEKDLNDSDIGVGLSSDGHYKNTAYIATPGLKHFLYGGMENEKEMFDQQKYQDIIEEDVRAGYFSGITIKEDFLSPSETSELRQIEAKLASATTEAEKEAALFERSKLVAKLSFGTDYALALSRYLYCINVPVNKEVMSEVVTHLNGLNHGLKDSKDTLWRGKQKPSDDYLWDAIYNNCAHTAHNAVAATGAVRALAVDAPLLSQIRNLGIPGSSLLKIQKQVQAMQIDPEAMFQNLQLRKALVEKNWMPFQHDNLMEVIPFHQKNELYEDTAESMRNHNPYMSVDILPSFVGKFIPSLRNFFNEFDLKAKKVRALGQNPIFSYQAEDGELALQDHYLYFNEKYDNALAKLQKIKSSSKYRHMLEVIKVHQKTKEFQDAYDYVRFMDKFEKQIEKQKESLESNLM
ncbi:MAG: hypothetical protein HQK50_10730 [Oligoflexia bacterium]|nr:hypothetical protein [Oligoflexia bacterium]